MKAKKKDSLSVRCPTCGAKRGEKCELNTGLPRTEPHRDRRLAASKKEHPQYDFGLGGLTPADAGHGFF